MQRLIDAALSARDAAVYSATGHGLRVWARVMRWGAAVHGPDVLDGTAWCLTCRVHWPCRDAEAFAVVADDAERRAGECLLLAAVILNRR